MRGSLGRLGEVDLSATPGNAAFLGINFTEMNLRLNGTSAGAKLGLDGRVGITDLGNLHFVGSAASNGDLAMTNEFVSGTYLFGYPVGNWNLVIRRQALGYAAVVAGSELNLRNRGDDPIAYWRLGETVGPVAADSKKPGFFAQAIPGVYSRGVIPGQPGALLGDGDTAARFNGSGGSVTIGNEESFDLTRSLTVEAWIKVPNWTRSWQAIVTKGDTSWRVSRYGDSSRISFDTSSAKGAHSLPSTRNLNDDQWHHVVAVYDGWAKYLYVDGVLDGFATYRETVLQNDRPVLIGANSDIGDRTFNGWIDEVAIYGQALAATEVMDHFIASGRAGITARVKLGLPGLSQPELVGTLRPDGGLCVQANGEPFGIVGFSLDGATVVLAKWPGNPATLSLGGSMSSPFGTFTMGGILPADGQYSLSSEASGSISIGSRNLTYSVPSTVSRSELRVAGSLAYGNFNFGGAATLSSGGQANFSGALSNTTDWKAFGRRLNGDPGHPYARLAWNAAASYDSNSQTISAAVSGNIEVDFEKFGGGYTTETLGFSTMNLPDNGSISVNPGKTFQGISNFDFTLP